MTATGTTADLDRETRAALRRLATRGRQYVTAQHKAETAALTAREAIAAAALLGVSVSEMARVSGLSRNAVYRALGSGR